MADRPLVAAFRPDDERAERATDVLESLGARPLLDPMLEVAPRDAAPSGDADVVVLTSTTGVGLLAERGWSPDGAAVAAIGEHTAASLREAGYDVDFVPEEYSSRGLVDALADRVEDRRVEVLRSDHGSDVLLAGLRDAGAAVEETVLYDLGRPADAGRSAALAADGDLDAALFTSSLTVEHFLAAAADRGVEADAVAGLADAVVGAIGDPTAETLRERDVPVDVVPESADFEALARAAVAALDER